MMGIRKSIKLILACSLASFSFTTFADAVDDAIVYCKGQGGTVVKESNGPATLVRTETVNGFKVEYFKECFQVLCYKATAGISEVDFTNIADFLAKTQSQRGAAQVAYDKNKCGESKKESRITDVDLYPDNDNDNDNDGTTTTTTTTTNTDGNVTVRGSLDIGPWSVGDVISVRINGDTRLITVGDTSSYRRHCIRNGRIRRRCRNGELVNVDTDVIVADSDRGVSSDIYIRGGGGGRDSDFVVNYRGRRYNCTAGTSIEGCLRDRYGIIISNVGDATICEHCGSRYYSRNQNGNSWGSILGGAAQLAGAVLPPVMGFLELFPQGIP